MYSCSSCWRAAHSPHQSPCSTPEPPQHARLLAMSAADRWICGTRGLLSPVRSPETCTRYGMSLVRLIDANVSTLSRVQNLTNQVQPWPGTARAAQRDDLARADLRSSRSHSCTAYASTTPVGNLGTEIARRLDGYFVVAVLFIAAEDRSFMEAKNVGNLGSHKVGCRVSRCCSPMSSDSRATRADQLNDKRALRSNATCLPVFSRLTAPLGL
jgi:hypothetical protein